MDDEEFDKISEDPDAQVEDDEMSPAEAGFSKGAEQAEESENQEDDEVY